MSFAEFLKQYQQESASRRRSKPKKAIVRLKPVVPKKLNPLTARDPKEPYVTTWRHGRHEGVTITYANGKTQHIINRVAPRRVYFAPLHDDERSFVEYMAKNAFDVSIEKLVNDCGIETKKELRELYRYIKGWLHTGWLKYDPVEGRLYARTSARGQLELRRREEVARMKAEYVGNSEPLRYKVVCSMQCPFRGVECLKEHVDPETKEKYTKCAWVEAIQQARERQQLVHDPFPYKKTVKE